jgi:hypothetical protein
MMLRALLLSGLLGGCTARGLAIDDPSLGHPATDDPLPADPVAAGPTPDACGGRATREDPQCPGTAPCCVDDCASGRPQARAFCTSGTWYCLGPSWVRADLCSAAPCVGLAPSCAHCDGDVVWYHLARCEQGSWQCDDDDHCA